MIWVQRTSFHSQSQWSIWPRFPWRHLPRPERKGGETVRRIPHPLPKGQTTSSSIYQDFALWILVPGIGSGSWEALRVSVLIGLTKFGKKKWGQIFILDFAKNLVVIHKLRPGKAA